MKKNSFMINARLRHRIFGKSLRYYAKTMLTGARHVVFEKMDVENRVFYSMPHHAEIRAIHHPLTLCYSVITGPLHIIYIKKTINIYMLLNAYIGGYIEGTPCLPWCMPGVPPKILAEK